ncbi:hypothetical protein [Cryobacterium sp. M91]|uniref:hypothetical protein n=1 Tax=Cryobacterium sp. M91 TaxID=2048294 RepID=UPI003517E09C
MDLKADIAPRTGLLALARLERELGDQLGTKVDVVASGLREHLSERVVKEAVPL